MLLQITVQFRVADRMLDVRPSDEPTAAWLREHEAAWKALLAPVLEEATNEAIPVNEPPARIAARIHHEMGLRWPEHMIVVGTLPNVHE